MLFPLVNMYLLSVNSFIAYMFDVYPQFVLFCPILFVVALLLLSSPQCSTSQILFAVSIDCRCIHCHYITALAIKLSALSLLWALVCSQLGFLLWNWNTVQILMGDLDSIFFGALFDHLVLHSPPSPRALICLCLVMGKPFRIKNLVDQTVRL